MKNMLGNIHGNYGLILLVYFDSLCSLVKLHSQRLNTMPIANAKEDHLITFVRIRIGLQAPTDGRNYNPIPVSEPQEPILAINPCRDVPSSD